jgi:hypothetical protein
VPPGAPDLDRWLPDPAVRVAHRRESAVAPGELWRAAQGVRLCDTSLLGRLIRWRIPGTRPEISFDELFREPPFTPLQVIETGLVSGLVGRIWTLRRDYPQLADPDEFRGWSAAGTARVLFGNWVEPLPGDRSVLRSETRVEAFGVQGRVGLASVRPLIRAFQGLVATDAMAATARRAERG